LRLDSAAGSFIWQGLLWIWGLINWNTVATALATFLGVYLAAYVREKRAAKAEHFRILKKEAIEPILAKLTSYHLPILDLKVANIVYDSISVEEDAEDVTVRPVKGWQKVLAVVSVQRIVSSEKWTSMDLDRLLYEDAKKTHFRRFIQNWENFERKVSEYHAECLRIARTYEEAIRSQKGELVERDMSDSDGSVGVVETAWWVFRKQMGTFPNDFLTVSTEPPAGNRVVLKTGPDMLTLARGEKSQIDRLKGVINGLVYGDSETRAFKERAASLAKEGLELEKKAKDILYSGHLRGNCKYY
jgi:hypothetical protein